MNLMTDRRSVAANATEANVVSGKLHEFINQESIVRIYSTAAAVGMFISALVGGESVVQDQEVSAQNRMPIVPDDFVAEIGAVPGDRVLIAMRNSTAAAIIGFVRVEIEPTGN